jgi:hypothetical protein
MKQLEIPTGKWYMHFGPYGVGGVSMSTHRVGHRVRADGVVQLLHESRWRSVRLGRTEGTGWVPVAGERVRVSFDADPAEVSAAERYHDDAWFKLLVDNYVEALVWSACGGLGATLANIIDHARAEIVASVAKFLSTVTPGGTVEEVLDSVSQHGPRQAGHDLAMTRNGHGVGFWDGDWPKPQAQWLTDACETVGQQDIFPATSDELEREDWEGYEGLWETP